MTTESAQAQDLKENGSGEKLEERGKERVGECPTGLRCQFWQTKGLWKRTCGGCTI